MALFTTDPWSRLAPPVIMVTVAVPADCSCTGCVGVKVTGPPVVIVSVKVHILHPELLTTVISVVQTPHEVMVDVLHCCHVGVGLGLVVVHSCQVVDCPGWGPGPGPPFALQSCPAGQHEAMPPMDQ